VGKQKIRQHGLQQHPKPAKKLGMRMDAENEEVVDESIKMYKADTRVTTVNLKNTKWSRTTSTASCMSLKILLKTTASLTTGNNK
jgi:hypothetical protein